MQYLWMVIAGGTAFVSGRGLIRWTLAAYLFGWLALIPLAFLPKKQDKAEQREAMIKEVVEKHFVRNEFKDFNTVDDLFKQLENK